MKAIKHIFPAKEEVAATFAAFLKEQINASERYSIALSGGSTPKILFEHLARHYAEDIDWSKALLFWGDERCVPPTDDDSNFKMTKTYLLDHITIPQENIFRILGENNPESEAQRYASEALRTLPIENNLPVFDLIILGMGGDGHTASIFPHQMELLEVDNWCGVATHPDSGQQRITLTGKVINAAKQIAFLVTGESKKEKVDIILHQKDGYKSYPAAHIQPTNGTLHWWMDEAAAIV